MVPNAKELETLEVRGSNTDNIKVNKPKDLSKILESSKVDPKEKLLPPQKAWFIEMTSKAKREEYILGTLGNFSLIIGKAKGRKTFFINIAVSSAISKDPIFGKFKSDLPKDQKQVLYFDTEQGKYHVQKCLKRICVQTGIDEPDNLNVYGLRKFKPKERLELIEHAINTIPNVGMVIIDGIKDLVNSINSEEEATMISSKLLKWTEEKNIHIICVLHQNKGDNNARGHIGTELINKAETVLSVNKDEDNEEISIMRPEMTRNKEPLSFAFKIDHRDLPVEVEGYSFLNKTTKSQESIFDTLDEIQKFDLLEEVYSYGDSFTYSELIIQIKEAVQKKFSHKLGDNKTKSFIVNCKNSDYLIQEGKKKPYTLIKRPSILCRDILS